MFQFPHTKMLTGLMLSSLIVLVAVGCTTMEPAAQVQPAAKMASGDIVAERQRFMKLNGASWKDIQDKAKAGQIEAIAVNAETIAINAPEIPALFPQGSLTDKSKAKPEVWQKWSEFEDRVQNLQAMAEKLREAATAKDAEATQAIVKDFGRQACGSCHTPFRVPPPRS
jgi:cytochrome c556